MATVAIDTSSVDHTLPDKFWGLNFSVGFIASDLSNASYRSLISEIAPEVWRSHSFRSSAGANDSGFDAAKAFMLAVLPNAAAIVNPDSGPAAEPSTADACSATNLAADGTGRSPNDHAALLAEWLDAGIDVVLFEFDNEPWGHCTSKTPIWYGGTGANPDGYKCESWVSVHQRHFYNALHAAITARGKQTKVAGHVFATSEGYGYSWTQSFINADAIQGACGSPYVGPGANLPYFENYVFHAYPVGSNNQDKLNSLLCDVVSAPPTNGTSLFSKLKDTRNKLDAAGGASKGITFDEAGLNDIGAASGLFDALYAIIASRYQAQFGIERFCYHSANTGTTSSPQYPLFSTSDHSTFTRTFRSYQLRDITSPYIRNYKRQCVPTITGSGVSPGTHPVDRIQASSGLNAAGDTLAVLVANVDLTNSETVTIDLGTVTPAGSAAVTYMRQSTPTGPMPTATLAPTANTFVQTVEPGAVYLFEIPLTAGGGGTDVTPPSITDLRVANEQTFLISFDEDMDHASIPATGDFNIEVDGAAVAATTVFWYAPAVLAVTYPVGDIVFTDDVSMGYTPGANPIQDLAGNGVGAFSVAALNALYPLPPANRVAGARVAGARVAGTRVAGTRLEG